jgi:hypothetical protein
MITRPSRVDDVAAAPMRWHVALRPAKLCLSLEKNRTGMTVHKTKFSGVSSLLLGLALGSKESIFPLDSDFSDRVESE